MIDSAVFKKIQKHFFQPDIYLIASSLKKVESILEYYCIKYLPYSIEKYKGLHLQTFQCSCKGPGQGHAILHNQPSLQKDSTPVSRLLKLLLAPQLLFLKHTFFFLCIPHPRKIHSLWQDLQLITCQLLGQVSIISSF